MPSLPDLKVLKADTLLGLILDNKCMKGIKTLWSVFNKLEH